jgi:hypothetical protein
MPWSRIWIRSDQHHLAGSEYGEMAIILPDPDRDRHPGPADLDRMHVRNHACQQNKTKRFLPLIFNLSFTRYLDVIRIYLPVREVVLFKTSVSDTWRFDTNPDPYHWITDPDLLFTDFQDAKCQMYQLFLNVGTFISFFKDKSLRSHKTTESRSSRIFGLWMWGFGSVKMITDPNPWGT